MNEETEKTILRRLTNLETHIINLIHPIQEISSVLTNSSALARLEKILGQPLKLEDNGLRYLLKELEVLLKQVNKNVEKLDVVQTHGEIKFIGKKLHQIEADIAEIKKDGIKRKIDLSFSCDGYEMVKIKSDKMNSKDPGTLLSELLSTLTERHNKVVVLRLGLFGTKPKTYVELGEILGITGSRARIIYLQALRKLRHPTRRLLVQACMHKELIKEVLGEE